MAIGAILLLGLILRLINLNQSLWLDEAVQAITSQGAFAGIFTELQGDFHPPLYHILMWAWVHLFGSSEVVLRLPSVLFGVGTIWVVYKIVKSFTSEEDDQSSFSRATLQVSLSSTSEVAEWHPARFSLAHLAALFMAVAPFHIYYSQEARMYAMTTFFACLSMYFFLKLFTSEAPSASRRTPFTPALPAGRSQVAGYILATALMLYSDYYGFLVLLAQIIAAFIFFKKQFISLYPRSEFKLRLYLYISISLLLFLPSLSLLFAQLKTGLQATATLPEWGRLVNVNFVKALPLTFVKFTLGRITIFNKKLYALVAGVLFGVFGGVGIRGGRRVIREEREKKDLYLVILLWLTVPISMAWFLSLFVPNYQPFRLLLVLPAFYLLLAMGVASIQGRTLKAVALTFILLTSLFSLLTYYTNPFFHREDWRSLVRHVERQKVSVAILPSATSDWAWKYYSQWQLAFSVSSGVRKVSQKDIEGIVFQPTPVSKVHYIRYLVDLFDPEELISTRLEELGHAKMKEISFNQIPVWVYKKK